MTTTDSITPEPTLSDEDSRNGGQGSQETPDDDRSRGNKEAAKWRTKLREAEADRDSVAARLEATQRREVASIIANDPTLPQLHRLEDLYDIGGATLADMLADDGTVDRDKIAATLEELKAERAYLFAERQSESVNLADVLSRQVHPGMPGYKAGPRDGDMSALGQKWRAAIQKAQQGR